MKQQGGTVGDIGVTLDDAKRRQGDERVVLESVYGEDFIDVSQNVWKVWQPLDVILHLKPIGSASTTSGKIYVSLDLHVKCPKTYPLSGTPFLSLENVKGISLKDVDKLKQILDNKAASLKGSEVILELCQTVQEFLYERNKPPEGSFFDGMLQQHAAVEHERKRQQVRSKQRDREDIVAFQKMHEEKLMWRKAEESEPTTPVDDSLCETFFCIDGVRRKLTKSPNNFRRRPDISPFCREWSATDCTTGHELFVMEWIFAAIAKTPLLSLKPFITHFKQLEKGLQKISRISITEPTLCNYEMFCVQKNKLTLMFGKLYYIHFIFSTSESICCGVIIGQNISGNDRNLSSQFDIFETDKVSELSDLWKFCQAMTLLVRLAVQLLDGLRFLHEKNSGHFDLDSTSIWITCKRNFRLSDYYVRSLLLHQCKIIKECVEIGGNIFSGLSMNKSPNHDFISLGNIFNKFRELSAVANDANFSGNLESFVKACRDAQILKTLMEHPFLHQDDSFKLLIDEGKDNFQQIAHSRLRNEFVFIEMLGKGGFGDVLLAKNKLDGNDYAIKRIPLDRKDERFNRKVTREAKLFSKLNHPNVVRYYSAWIEQASVAAREIGLESNGSEVSVDNDQKEETEGSLMPLQIKNIEKMARRIAVDATAEWSTSFQMTSTYEPDSVSEEQHREPVQTLFSPTDLSTAENSDFEVLFEDEGDNEDSSDESAANTPSTPTLSHETAAEDSSTLPLRILFIQMEYCEKSTLRSLIDSSKLMKNSRQIWRLFREILLGLQYIHQEGMIHRDIKPMNVLIDGSDHAKIGDFGLATRDIVSKNLSSLNESDMNFSMTKDIGTALYIAPELLSTANGSIDYTTKIDVYSLGIVLFEMFYRPLLPGMERIAVIKNLRGSSYFPSDFGTGILEIHQKAAKKLIKWMLEIKPDDRPSVQTLLESDRIPVAEIEENDFQRISNSIVNIRCDDLPAVHFQKMFCQTIRSGGRLHHWIIDTLIANPILPAADYLYDRDRLSLPRLRAVEHLRNKLCNICSTHAFIPFDVHSITPFNIKNAIEMTNSKSRACRFVDENGITVMLPYDLRRAFARYCVRNGVNRLKRYGCGKVFGRPDALVSMHPIERIEFAIDAIGPLSSSQMLTADILCIAVEAAHQLDCISSRKWEIRLGHRDLVIASALYLGFGDSSTQRKILNVLYAVSTSNKKLSHEQKIERLRVGTEMSFNQANSLLNVLEGDDCTLEALMARTECLVNCRDDRVQKHAKRALSDLTNLAALLECFIDDMAEHILFDGTLCYRPHTYCSGLMFQLRVLFHHRQTTRPVIIGAGGRYDTLLEDERHAQDLIPPSPLCAVGCSLSLDILAQFCCTNKPDFGSICGQALVCSVSDQLLKTTANLVKQMWSRGIQADILHDPVAPMRIAELDEHCSETNIEILLVVYGEDEVLVRVGGINLGKLTFDEMLSKFETYQNGMSFVEAFPHAANTSSPVRHSVCTLPVAATLANLNVRYALTEKPAAHIRKRNETQIRACLQKVVSALAPQTVVEVIVTEISVDAIRLLATLIDRSFTVEELSSAFSSAIKQLNKFKRDFKRIEEVIGPFFQPKNTSPIVLYSKQDCNGYYKLIL
uniref:non-specific serine/threonine protein kinase n=1 Tax=Elaeophora elaphi TaxID=1147741 RepID=A0A0R3RYI5_9BILA